MPSQKQQKKPPSSGWNHLRYILVKFPLKVANFKYDRRDFTHVYFNVTEWFACPRGPKFSKPIEQMSKELLNVCLAHFHKSSRKKDGTYYISSSRKFIVESPLIVSFPRCRTTKPCWYRIFWNLAKLKVEDLLKQLFYSLWLDSQLGTSRLVGYSPSRIQRGLME